MERLIIKYVATLTTRVVGTPHGLSASLPGSPFVTALSVMFFAESAANVAVHAAEKCVVAKIISAPARQNFLFVLRRLTLCALGPLVSLVAPPGEFVAGQPVTKFVVTKATVAAEPMRIPAV